MLLVHIVDKSTRLVLPNTQWSNEVLNSLSQMGHSVELTDQDPESLVRDADELARRDQLLDSTGL